MNYELTAHDLQLTLHVVEALIMLSDGSIVTRALNALESILLALINQQHYGLLAYEVRMVLLEHGNGDLGRLLGIVALRPNSYQSSVAEELIEKLETLIESE